MSQTTTADDRQTDAAL